MYIVGECRNKQIDYDYTVRTPYNTKQLRQRIWHIAFL